MCLLPSRAKDIYAHESDAELTSLMDRLVMRASVIAGQDPQLMYGKPRPLFPMCDASEAHTYNLAHDVLPPCRLPLP
jgi:hypothetical protein